MFDRFRVPPRGQTYGDAARMGNIYLDLRIHVPGAVDPRVDRLLNFHAHRAQRGLLRELHEHTKAERRIFKPDAIPVRAGQRTLTIVVQTNSSVRLALLKSQLLRHLQPAIGWAAVEDVEAHVADRVAARWEARGINCGVSDLEMLEDHLAEPMPDVDTLLSLEEVEETTWEKVNRLRLIGGTDADTEVRGPVLGLDGPDLDADSTVALLRDQAEAS